VTSVPRFAVAVLLCAAAPLAHAAHPIISEDPGTQGTGGVELEIGFQASDGDPGGGRTSLLTTQVAIGLAPTVDLLVVPRYLWLRPAGAPHERGIGDTSLDVKWRFFENDTVQLAVRAGAELATGDESKGLGADGTGWHAVLAMSVDVDPMQWLVNVGYVRGRVPGERTQLPYASAAVVGPSEGRLRSFVEVAAQANSDPSRTTWPAVVRTGLMWKAAPWLDLDVGAEGRLNRAAPRATLLAGATLRW
jgi:hypothetical protein